MAERITSGTIRAALRALLPTAEYALMFEVRDSTGHSGRRSADAIAMNLWPSRGLLVEGFEIKVSRSDWLSELRKPAKAEVIATYCDRWWLATVPGIVKDGELPVSWGLMELEGAKLVRKVQAPTLEPKPLDRGFMAAMLRRVSGADDDEVKALAERILAPERERMQAHIEDQIERRTSRLQQQSDRLAAIEKALGFSLDGWESPENFAARMEFAKRLGVGGYGALKTLARQAKDLAEQVEKFTGAAEQD